MTALAVIYCVVPRALAPRLHEPLRNHFRADTGVDVVVEQRARDRRTTRERRGGTNAIDAERRRIKSVEGRRVADRRASALPVDSPVALPRRARPYADQLVFFERIEPSELVLEDHDTARLVMRIQAGERDAFADLYMRYFDRVYSYLLVVLTDRHEAEDATQHVFTKILEGLSRYERRSQPFRAWLFTAVRNHAISELEKRTRINLVEPAEIGRQRRSEAQQDEDLSALGWITDRELLMFIERLPLAQRQVLMLRYMLDLTSSQVAAVLDRSPEDVRTLQRRALAFLRERLTALGRGTKQASRPRMRRVRPQSDVLRSRRFRLLA